VGVRVSGVGLILPKPTPIYSGVTQTQSTRVSPVDLGLGLGSGGSIGFGFSCHPYIKGLICNKKKIQRLKLKICEYIGTKMIFKSLNNYFKGRLINHLKLMSYFLCCFFSRFTKLQVIENSYTKVEESELEPWSLHLTLTILIFLPIELGSVDYIIFIILQNAHF
jgi:hypothetical protein